MKSLIAGNLTIATMWLTTLLSQIDGSFFALSATIATAIATGFGAIWLQLWRGQDALLKAKDKMIERETARCKDLEERLDRERDRNQELEDIIHSSTGHDEGLKKA